MSSWKELRPAAVALSDGRLAVFKVTKSGRLEYRVQASPMSPTDSYRYIDWISAQTINEGPLLAGSPSAVLNADNTLTVVALGADGVMYSLRQTVVDPALPASSFGAWSPMPVLGSGLTFAGSPSATELSGDAQRDVVVLGSDGNIWTTTQVDAVTWSSWTKRYGATESLVGSIGPVRRGDAPSLSELWVVSSTGDLKTTASNWSGGFANYGGAWVNSPTGYLAGPNNRLTVAGTNAFKDLVIQQFLPEDPFVVVGTKIEGSPASARSGSTSYLFTIRADGRVQFSAVAADGTPIMWYVIDQPPAPQPVSPADGAIVYAPGEVTLVANPVLGADEYRFELWKLTGSGREAVATHTATSPTWTLPAGTMTAGSNYHWTVRAWNNTTKLLSDWRMFGMVASNQTAAPTLVRPTNGGLVDPYRTIELTAGAVYGADTYTFRVFRQPLGNQVWSATVGITAAPGQPVTVLIPPGTLPVGSRYTWNVDARVSGSNPTTSPPASFVATTGAAASSLMARTTSGQGYWLLAANGQVATYGDAVNGYQGEVLSESAVGIVARPRSLDDYWIVTASGAIFSFNGAQYYGGANSPTGIRAPHVAVGMAPTPTGNGYWILAEDGAVYSFGDAQYFGGANGPGGIQPNNSWAVSITPTPTGNGYWILGKDGAVFAFGDAAYLGGANNPTGIGPNDVAISLQATPTGEGYWIASRTGAVFTYPPNRPDLINFHGAANVPGHLEGKPAIGFAGNPYGTGYWFEANDGAIFTYGAVDYWGGANVPAAGATPAQPASPADDSKFFPRDPSAVPTLTVSGGSGANGRVYQFILATDPTASTEVVEASGWQASPSWSPQARVLKDGRTYFWRVLSRDTGNSNPASLSSRVAWFRVDRRFGTGGPSPREVVGPVSVNLATGNATTSWSSPTVSGAGLSLTYNSMAPIDTPLPGLPVGWSASWSGDTAAQSLWAAGGTVTVTMVDGSKESFTWKEGITSGNSWQSTIGSDSTLTEISGSRWIYTTADGTVHEFDAYGNLTATHQPEDARRSSATKYTWAVTPVGRRMTTAQDPVSGRSMRLYFQGDGQNGCPSAPPVGSAAAPPGYLCRVRLMDDRTYDIGYAMLSSSIVQIGKIVGSDGSVSRWAWEVANSAALGGQYPRMVGIVDSLASDVIAAGLRADDASVRTEIGYQADGRVKSVTLPAPTAGAQRQKVSISYAGVGATVKRDGDQQPNGYSRQVESDSMGHQTLERDQAGRVTTTGWRIEAPGDVVAWVQDPSGLRTGTAYDDQWKPIETWGPAPASWFDASSLANQWGAIPSAANQPNTQVTRTTYDGGMTGLAHSYFDSVELTGGVKRRAFASGGAAALQGVGLGGVQGLPADNWSMRAEGLLIPPVTGTYQFRADHDGGIRVYMDDIKILDGWDAPEGFRTTYGIARSLTANKSVRLRVEYRDRGGDAQWALWWTPPGGASGWIPPANLRPNYALVTSTTDPDGRVTNTSYVDAAAGLTPADGLPTSVSQPVGGGQADLVSKTTYEPDSATVGWRRQLTRTLPSGPASTVSYAYYPDAGDPVANSCGVEAGVSQAGLPKSTTAADPDGAGPQKAIKRWYVYDSSGRTRGLLTTTADVAESALGSQPWVCTTYDGRGRPTKITYPAFGGSAARTVNYDYSNPLEVRVTDLAGTIISTIDLLGRTTSYQDALGKPTTSTYDLAGRPVSSTLLGQTTTNTYRADGLLDTVSINNKVVATTAYEPDGRLKSVSYPSGSNAAGNGTSGEFSYDALLRPVSVTWKTPAGTLIASENVTRMLGGNLRERWYDGNNLNGSNPDFTYDGAGRLTTAVVDSITYSYGFADTASCGSAPGAGKNSNRTSKTVGGATTSYCYDAADRLTSTSDPAVGTITYDSRGNTTGIFGETRTYDIADRHLSTTNGTTTVTYVRDAADRIIERKVNGTTVAQYVSSGGADSPSATIDKTTGRTEFTWVLPGGALYTYKPNNTASNVWTYPNLQGSALAVADQTGVKQGSTIQWDPDGNNIEGGMPDNMPGAFDYGWLGQHQRPLEHEAGLAPTIEMGARQYSPQLGRFLEVDPIEGGTANDYAYVADSINEVDLDGQGICLKFWACKKKSKAKKKGQPKKLQPKKLTDAELIRVYSAISGLRLDSSYKLPADLRKRAVGGLERARGVQILTSAPTPGSKADVYTAVNAGGSLWVQYESREINSSLAAIYNEAAEMSYCMNGIARTADENGYGDWPRINNRCQ